MKQEQLTDLWNLLAAKAIVWGWQNRSYGAVQALIKDDRFVFSRKGPYRQISGGMAGAADDAGRASLARAMEVLKVA